MSSESDNTNVSDTADTAGMNHSAAVPIQQQKLLKDISAVFAERLTRLPDLAWKPFGLQYSVEKDQAFSIFETLRDDPRFSFSMLVDLSAIDWMDRREPRFDVVYHLLSISLNTRLCIRVGVDEESPTVASVLPLWHSANFMEREVWDMFGISFEGHGDLRRILMYEEFVGHPLRKDYPVKGKQPRIPLRIPELRNTSEDMKREQLVSLPVRQRFAAEKS